MNLKLGSILFTIFLVFLALTGCSVSKEQAIQLAKDSFEAGILSEAKEPNEESGLFRYYLPSSLSIEEVKENNLILSKGEQLFLIFSNPAENQSSRVNFEQDKLIEEDAILIEMKEVEGTFSYIVVSPFKDGDYKVIVGNGGEKGTTITSIANFKESVEILLEIIQSIKY